MLFELQLTTMFIYMAMASTCQLTDDNNQIAKHMPILSYENLIEKQQARKNHNYH